MRRFLFIMLCAFPIFYANTATAEELEFDLGEALAKIKKSPSPISLEARLFTPSTDAHIKSDSVSLNGGMIGLKNDLNLKFNRLPEFILRYKRFTADYIHIHDADNANFDGILNFGSTDYFGGVYTRNDIHYIKLNVNNEILSLMGTGADWTYGLTGIAWKGTVDNSERNFTLVPTLGVDLYVAVAKKMKLYLNFSGMNMGGHGHLSDFETGLRYSPSKHFTWTLGFRSIDTNIKYKGTRGDLQMNGPFFGLRSDF